MLVQESDWSNPNFVVRLLNPQKIGACNPVSRRSRLFFFPFLFRDLSAGNDALVGRYSAGCTKLYLTKKKVGTTATLFLVAGSPSAADSSSLPP